MLSIGLRQLYINMTITILCVVHRPDLFKTRLQVEPSQLGPTDLVHRPTE
jgi:hypothetical protein